MLSNGPGRASAEKKDAGSERETGLLGPMRW